MNTFQVLPIPMLRPFIDRLWGLESTEGEVVHLPTLLSGTGAELYFHYRAPFQYTTHRNSRRNACDFGHLFCVRREPVQLWTSSSIGFIAVRFRVGMIHRFTEIPGAELLDRALAVDDIWGTSGAALIRHLSYASTVSEKLSLIQRFLTKHLRNSPLDYAVEQAMPMLYRKCSSISIQQLAESMHLSRRQLERRFMQVVGQTPCEVRCLSRFQRTIRELMLDTSANPKDVALTNGYYDQAHFIHEFKKLTNTTPHQHLADARTKTHFYNTSLQSAGTLLTPNPPF